MLSNNNKWRWWVKTLAAYRQAHEGRRRRTLGAVLHSSNEPGELSQWLCHDYSSTNIVLGIIMLVVILLARRYALVKELL